MPRELVCVRLEFCCSAPATDCGSCRQLGSRAGPYRHGVIAFPERREAVEHRLVPEGCCHLLSVENSGFGGSGVGLKYHGSGFSHPTRWSTTLSSRFNLPHVTNFRALCGAKKVT